MAGAVGDAITEKLADPPALLDSNPSQASFTYTDEAVYLSSGRNRLSDAAQRLWERAFPLGFKSEFLIMFGLSWPAILTTFFQFFLQTTSIIMCGQLGKIDLDSVALANSFINVAGICIGVGMSTACDTLFSQTFGGRNKKRMGMYLQRGLLVMYSALVLLWCVHLNIRPLLLLLGQNPLIADKTARYMLFFMPGLFFDYSFLVLSRYLQNQNVMYPPMVAGFIGNVFNVVSQYIAIHLLGYGYIASAVLQAASLALMFFITLGYTLASGIYKDTWDGWKVEALYDWGSFIKLAVPGIFLIALEEWSFEIATIVAGTLGDVQLGAQSIVFQLEAISYMIPFGISVAVNIRVGQQLGGNNPIGASQSYRTGLLMMTLTAFIMLAIFTSMRNYLPYIFSSDAEIVHVASNVLPILGAFQIADGVAATSSGAIRGCGRQVQGAIVLFIGFYVIGLPVAISLALATELQVMGMWIGLLVGYSIEAVAFCCLVLRLNWRSEARLAQIRAYGSDGDLVVATETDLVDEADQEEEAAEEVLADNKKITRRDHQLPTRERSHDESAALQLPSDAESEYAPLMSSGGSHRFEVAFYSDPESCAVPVLRYQRRRRRRRQRRGAERSFSSARGGRRRHAEFMCTGRFYSRSFSVLLGDSSEEEDDDEDEEDDDALLAARTSWERLKPVLVKRLVMVAALLAALAGALALRMLVTADGDRQGHPATTAPVSTDWAGLNSSSRLGSA